MSTASFRPAALDTAATLRLAQAGQAITTLDGLTQGVQELSHMMADIERDLARLRHRRGSANQLQSRVAREIADVRVAEEARVLAGQAQNVQQALRAVKTEASALGERDLPEAQAQALREQLDSDEAAAQAAYDELLALLEGQGGQAVRADRLEAPTRVGANAAALGGATSLSAAGEPHAPTHAAHRTPPEALRAGLNDLVQDVRRIAYASKIPAPEAMDGRAPTDPRVAALQSRWASWSERTQAPVIMDPNEMTQWVMRQSYIDNSADMRSYAMKLQFQTSLKATIRDELTRARQARSDLSKGSESKDKALSAPYSRKRIRKDADMGPDGVWRVRAPEDDGEIVDVDALNDYIRDLETALSTSSDDMQIAQLELQGMTQRQQQVLNALSNLSKVLHETSMSILRKIGN